MLSIKDAKDILSYYGFVSTSVEPTLCQNKNNVGIFATFKTKYGHLSRFVNFNSKNDMEKFLGAYLWYRKNINDSKLIVEFDDYEKISPKIKFIYNNIEVTNSNLTDIKLLNSKVEELIIDTSDEDNMALLNIIFGKIRDRLKEIDEFQNSLEDTILEYKEKLKEYNKCINNVESNKISMSKINTDKYYDEINKVSVSYINDKNKNFSEYFSKTIKLYEEILINEIYFENLYLFEYYKEQIREIDFKISLYAKYIEEINNQKNKLFKSKKGQLSFEEYLANTNFEEQYINKEELIYNKKTEFENSLIQLKNNSVDELKLIYKIVVPEEKNILEKSEEVNIIDIDSLNYYFMSLSKQERNDTLALSSPLKDLINLIRVIEEKDKKIVILTEKYYKDKFVEMYEILSSKDNYAATRKYLKFLKLDSLEDFIDSLVNYTNNINITPFGLPKNNILKFKMGVFLNQGYLNASITNNYPVNSKGVNNYCVTTTLKDIHAFYSPYILKLDNDNILEAVENNDVITFDLQGLKFVDKKEQKVNNYMLKKKGKDEFSFILFNEKYYIDSKIDTKLENGEFYE